MGHKRCERLCLMLFYSSLVQLNIIVVFEPRMCDCTLYHYGSILQVEGPEQCGM
jgi:hypothetical protein